MIDQIASTIALAKTVRDGVDRRRVDTSVPTATLLLLIETLIELGTPSINRKIEDGAQRAVLGHTVAVEGELKARG